MTTHGCRKDCLSTCACVWGTGGGIFWPPSRSQDIQDAAGTQGSRGGGQTPYPTGSGSPLRQLLPLSCLWIAKWIQSRVKHPRGAGVSGAGKPSAYTFPKRRSLQKLQEFHPLGWGSSHVASTPSVHLMSFRVQEAFQLSKQTLASRKVTGETEAQESPVTPGELLSDPAWTVRCITVCAQGQTHRLVTDQHPFRLLRNQKSGSPPQEPPDLPSTPLRGWENTENTGSCPSHIPTTPGGVAGKALTRKGQPACKRGSLPILGTPPWYPLLLCGHCFHVYP